jgi:hypothetical protein
MRSIEKLKNLGRLCLVAHGIGCAARKALNIFLRDVFYNHYLREEYGFGRLEQWLELPLDMDAARGLREDSGDVDIQLPR